MQYQVPQFIEVETKLFGPLTFKQFIYIAGATALVMIMYFTLPIWLVFPLGIPVALLGAALAFYKVNNQPFIKVIDNAFRYTTSPRLFLWKKAPPKAVAQTQVVSENKVAGMVVPRFTQNKLKDLAWSLDVKEKMK